MQKKRFNNDKKEHFLHKGSLKAIIHSYITLFCNICICLEDKN